MDLLKNCGEKWRSLAMTEICESKKTGMMTEAVGKLEGERLERVFLLS